MKYILSSIFTLCICLAYTTARADISCGPTQCCGQLTFEDGVPAMGVTVVIQPTPNGRHNSLANFATSDSDGYFVIYNCNNVINAGTGTGYLRAAFVGYVPFETTITTGEPVYGTLFEDLSTDDNIICSNNEYREYDFSTNTGTCIKCPTHNNIDAQHNYNESGNPFYGIYDCYIPENSKWTFSDSTGSGEEFFTSGACYYQ